MIHNSISTETRLLLLLSRVSIDGFAEEVQSISDSGPDWGYLISLAIKHGTSNFIYKNLLKLNNIPQDAIDKFRNIYKQTVYSNILKVAELDRILKGLERLGIEAIVLKGPITSEIIFGDLGIYPSSDIDILVKVKDIDQTRDFLETMEYSLNDKGFDEYKGFFLKELYHISLSNGKFAIEPHWNLFFRYFTAPPEFWWEESTNVSTNGRVYRFLAAERNLLYTSFRVFSKSFEQLRYLVMVAEIVRYYKEEIDWDKLLSYANKFHFENVLIVTLHLCRELLGTPVDERICKIKSVRARILYPFIRSTVLRGSDFNPVTRILLSFLRDDLFGTCKVLFRRLFPSRGEIVSRYRLPVGSNRALLYYFLNPILVLSRKHQKL